MVDEARKTNAIRGESFWRRYFQGRVIDIGCGPDLVVAHAEPFDVEQGDANRLLDYFAPETFDCVHSSHCLEHMTNVPDALRQWWALVRPGGHLIVVVPHEDLYEQRIWPSIFNPDHKATFNIGKRESWSPVSYDLEALLRNLPQSKTVEICLQDTRYDYRMLGRSGTWRGSVLLRLAPWRKRALRVLARFGIPTWRLGILAERAERAMGKPFDQTLNGPALAQIQAIVCKLPRPPQPGPAC